MKINTFTKIILVSILSIFIIGFNYKFNIEGEGEVVENIKIYETSCGKYKKGKIKINENILLVDIADDECKKILGLSGKESLIEDGMLFIFENIGNYGFWMKDMNFPIDILWINEYFEIIGIEKDLSPNTYPKFFGTEYLAKYVLEVPANYSDKNKIKVGDEIIFTIK